MHKYFNKLFYLYRKTEFSWCETRTEFEDVGISPTQEAIAVDSITYSLSKTAIKGVGDVDL